MGEYENSHLMTMLRFFIFCIGPDLGHMAWLYCDQHDSHLRIFAVDLVWRIELKVVWMSELSRTKAQNLPEVSAKHLAAIVCDYPSVHVARSMAIMRDTSASSSKTVWLVMMMGTMIGRTRTAAAVNPQATTTSDDSSCIV